MSGPEPSGSAAAAPQFLGARTEQARIDEEFSAFYRKAIGPLVGFLIYLGARLPLASDLAQETMIDAYKHWCDINRPDRWILTVASRRLLRHRLGAASEDTMGEVPEPGSLLPYSDLIGSWEVRHDFVKILDSLPSRQRQVLAWTLRGFTPAEIADELGISANTVSANLKKARRKVSGLLQVSEEGE